MAEHESAPWAPLSDREHKARKAVVHLIAAGVVPDAGALAGAVGCSRAASRQLLETLATKGCAVRDGMDGRIVAAYPLSIRPTRHRVTLGTGQRVHALCAVDALGTSPLFGTSAVVESSCPHCRRTIRLRVEDGEVRVREPSGAALWYTLTDLLERPIAGLNLSAEH